MLPERAHQVCENPTSTQFPHVAVWLRRAVDEVRGIRYSSHRVCKYARTKGRTTTGAGSFVRAFSFKHPRASDIWLLGYVLLAKVWKGSLVAHINGQYQPDIDGLTLAQMLDTAGFDAKRVACEVNGAIVSPGDFVALVIGAADVIEVVHFVGGG